MEGRGKNDKRGFAYQCQGCHKYEGEKRYVEAHYYKYHAALDTVPFYCSLCHFMGKTEREVLRHTKGYRPHKLAEENLILQGKKAEDILKYVHKNEDPLQLTEVHVKKLTWEESQQIWMSRAKKSNEEGNTTASENPGVQAESVVPDLLTIIPEPLREDEPLVPAPILPEIPLPINVDDAKEFNILDEILQQEGIDQFAVESREEEKMELMRDTLSVLRELLEATKQNGQLLTMVNTGLRKNTMVLEEIGQNTREQRREERRRRETTFSRTSTPRRPAVRSTVKKVD